jgi:hypothetical protein
MPRKSLYIRYQLRLLGGGRGPADAPAEGDGLAGDFALEGSEDELVFRSAIQNVEPRPIHAV